MSNDLFGPSPVRASGPVEAGTRREAEVLRLALRAAAQLRRPFEQHDVDGLALFDSARSPTLF